MQTFDHLYRTHFTNQVIYTLISSLLVTNIRNKETYECWDDMLTKQRANKYTKNIMWCEPPKKLTGAGIFPSTFLQPVNSSKNSILN